MRILTRGNDIRTTLCERRQAAEYKVLAIELKQIGNGEMEFELSSGANGTQELQRLTKEGFIVRDLFNCYLSDKKNKPSRFKILLERVR